ncbi:type I-E CRISPR-associated protein Cas7/Cse4/CasC [Saccharopolyspora hordei]|uniref:CRISPR system Cascade subunit CasC n=1 Tax=Saccharopolyspora hordei TaxID=1838 RepID=A0A853AR65_9PSEU|nr:type I-E CRISPR-associated protein Cas7/Cse4/CasC [Saccharopolyspora hordei]NYI83561.1 CRISPR system Cascade subunit CasC [Saccharopolyspora hordei]
MILELHLLQSFPVSNLNRDDLGQPKSATFGGVPRARISSQSLKRAARDLFAEHGLDPTHLGSRTKRLVTKTAEVLGERGHDAGKAAEIAAEALHLLGFGVEQTQLTQYLLFVGKDAIDLLANFCEQNWSAIDKSLTEAKEEAAKKKKTKSSNKPTKRAKVKPSKEFAAAAKRIFDATRAADIALFGRMIADNTDFNVTAASQVAHALSTHAVTTEFDYYTAVDDLKRDAEPGADMIGTIDFNSACYYRYANLDLAQLAKNLDGDDELVAAAARAWLGAFIHATPGGKQSTTAARTMPETFLGTVRTRGAWNLANAFLRPVTGTDLLGTSTERLFTHFKALRDFYGTEDLRTVVGAALSCSNDTLPTADVVTSVGEFTSRLLATALDHA